MCTENATLHRHGLFGAWSQAGVGFGFVLSAGAFYATRLISGSGFAHWSWRIPFLLSVVAVAAGLIIRSKVPESAEFQRVADAAHCRQPIRDVLALHRSALLIASGLLLAEMCGHLLTTTFALAYGSLRGVSANILLLSMVADTLAMLFFGYLSDRIGRTPVYAFGILGLAVFITPFFLLIGSNQPLLVVLAFIVANGCFHAAMIDVQPALLTELFPVDVRSSGLALTQSIAAILVGVLPLGTTSLFYWTGSILPIAVVMISIYCVSLVVLLLAHRQLERKVSERV